MQTFLPYPDLRKSAECLDDKRLGKQRVEAYQILRCLSGLSKGWRNHPAVQMWRGHETALAQYGWHCCTEWIRRGFMDNLREKFERWLNGDPLPPSWFGNPAFHAAHRAARRRERQTR